jgi:hypothetical protein
VLCFAFLWGGKDYVIANFTFNYVYSYYWFAVNMFVHVRILIFCWCPFRVPRSQQYIRRHTTNIHREYHYINKPKTTMRLHAAKRRVQQKKLRGLSP